MRQLRLVLTSVIICFLGITASGETAYINLPDSIGLTTQPDSTEMAVAAADNHPNAVNDSVFDTLPWYRQLMENGFEIHDPRINYPKFPRFCLKVYDWGDRTFNSYDKEYVVGTGQNWKVMLKNYNWMTSYMMFFDERQTLHMRSNIYQDLGAYICFMAVSVGYTAKVDNLIGQGRKTRENFNFSFTSSLFSVNFNYWKTTGDAVITKFGDYDGGDPLHYDFNNVRMQSYSAEAYYFFNHLRYSQSAAYAFSKYQLKSAGSWIAGMAFAHQTLDLDFSSLPPDMKEHLPVLKDVYRFRYNDYDLMGGYAYNWVLKPRKWLINATVLPSLGWRYSYQDSTDGKHNMFSTNLRAMLAAVYNHNALFATIQARFDGHLYYNRDYTFFDSVESVSLIVGARF